MGLIQVPSQILDHNMQQEQIQPFPIAVNQQQQQMNHERFQKMAQQAAMQIQQPHPPQK